MPFKPTLIFLLVLCFACTNNAGSSANKTKSTVTKNDNALSKNPYHSIDSIPLPMGYKRISGDAFANWLRHTALKEDKLVRLYNGNLKANQLAQFAVLNISVGHSDLQQCADAVMRLRAEYLFAAKQYDAIVFTDNANTAYIFKPPYNRENFMQYMQQVFGMCGSASLSKQLKPVANLANIQPGDVLIRGGFPGHAVIVMDVAANDKGKKIFMLAQSYMPAQDIHVLVNSMNENLSPWYEVNGDNKIITPEYLFYRNELKAW